MKKKIDLGSQFINHLKIAKKKLSGKKRFTQKLISD